MFLVICVVLTNFCASRFDAQPHPPELGERKKLMVDPVDLVGKTPVSCGIYSVFIIFLTFLFWGEI